VESFALSEAQAQAILDMRLQRLTGLERSKLEDELAQLKVLIARLNSILSDASVLLSVMREETIHIRDTFATKRRTEVVREALVDIDIEDLIPDEDVVITLSRRGYVKRTPLASYTQQRRGGKGVAGVQTADDDFVQDFLTTSNHQFLLLFTNRGRMHQLKVHQVPEGGRTAKGMHMANLIPLDKEEYVATALTVREFSQDHSFFFVTRRGMVKRSNASLYARCRKIGMIAAGLRDDDDLIAVRQITCDSDVLLATSDGMGIRFRCSDVRESGRGASGVKGIALRRNDTVVAAVVLPVDDIAKIMSMSSLGYGKRTSVDLYPLQTRGGRGTINFRISPKTGPVIGAMPVKDDDALVLLTSTNKIIRMSIEEVRSIGRATMGVRLVRLDPGAVVVGFDTVDKQEDAEASDLDSSAAGQNTAPAPGE
jgi:DNA gyrase subunit A